MLGSFRIHQRGVGGYSDGLGCRSQREDNIDAHGLGHQNPHALLNELGEASRFNTQVVYTRRQLRHGIVSRFSGNDPILRWTSGIVHDNTRTGDNGADRVRDGAID